MFKWNVDENCIFVSFNKLIASRKVSLIFIWPTSIVSEFFTFPVFVNCLHFTENFAVQKMWSSALLPKNWSPVTLSYITVNQEPMTG